MTISHMVTREDVAAWFLRLKGFFTTETFVVQERTQRAISHRAASRSCGTKSSRSSTSESAKHDAMRTITLQWPAVRRWFWQQKGERSEDEHVKRRLEVIERLPSRQAQGE